MKDAAADAKKSPTPTPAVSASSRTPGPATGPTSASSPPTETATPGEPAVLLGPVTVDQFADRLIGVAEEIPLGSVDAPIRKRIAAAITAEHGLYESPFVAGTDPVYRNERTNILVFSAARAGAATPYRSFFLVLPSGDRIVYLPRAAEALMRVYAELAPGLTAAPEVRDQARYRLTPTGARSALPHTGGREELWYYTGAGWVRITYDPSGAGPMETVEISAPDHRWSYPVAVGGMELEPQTPTPPAGG